jgi:tetratricopeptide (TPR) repeat protein
MEFAKIRLTMSIGIASCPEDGSDWSTVFNVADHNLYSAKRHGRDRIGIRTLEEKNLIIPTVELIGRSSELSMLKDTMESVISSKGEAVCISGEAGVGKSRLFQEISFLTLPEKTVFICSNLSTTTCSIPYYPFREILRSLIFIQGEQYFENLPRVYQIELAKIVPEILRKPVDIVKEILMVDRFRLFEGVRKFLELQVANCPLFICIDNIHWADENSLELLQYLLRVFRNKPILFVLVYRIEEIQHSVFQDVLHSMARENLIKKIILEPLGKNDITRMISSIIDAEYPSELTEYIYKETGGNPFFIEELLKSLKNEGALNWNGNNYDFDESSAKTIPYSVEGVIERKLEKLSDKAYSFLEHASVIGRTFSFSFLRTVTEINEGQLFDLLDEIFEKRLLSERDGEHYFFSEDIIREIIYNRMSRTRLSRFHRKIGEKLLSLNSENIEKVVEELSYHFYQCGDKDNTVKFSIIAGDRAKAAYANQDAIRFYTRAIDSLESLENANTETLLSKCLRNRSSVYNLTGENDLAIADLERAISNSELTGNLCDKADSLIEISKVYKDISSYDKAVESAEEAFRIYRKEKNVKGEAFSLARIAIGKRMLREYEVSIGYFQRSLKIVRKHSLHEIEVKALNGMGSSYTGMGNYEKAVKLYDESLNLSKKVGDKAGQIASLVNTGNINYYRGNFERAVELYREAMIIIKDIGNRRSEAITCNNLGCICILMGDYSNARKYLSNSLEKYKETGDKVNEAGCNLNLGEMYARHGKIKKAIDLIDDTIRIYEENPDPDGLTKCYIRKGRSFLENNDIKNAGDCFSKAEKIAKSIKSNFLIASVLAAKTTRYLEEGEIAKARKRLEELLSLLAEFDSKEIQAEANYLEGRISLEEDLRFIEIILQVSFNSRSA